MTTQCFVQNADKTQSAKAEYNLMTAYMPIFNSEGYVKELIVKKQDCSENKLKFGI